MESKGPLLLVAAVCTAVFMAGCSNSVHPKNEASGAIREAVPPGWTVQMIALDDFESGPQTGTLLSTFSGKIVPKTDMAVAVGKVDGKTIVKVALGEEDAAGIYGKIIATKLGEKWIANAKIEKADPEQILRRSGLAPIDTFAPYVVEGSDEARALAEEAQNRTLAAEARRTEAERQRLDEQAKRARMQNEARMAEVERRVAAAAQEKEVRRQHQLNEARKDEEQKAQLERLRRANVEKLRREVFEVVTNAHGLRVVSGLPQSRANTYLVTDTDPDSATLSFSGVGVQRSPFPFRETSFQGRIDLDGTAVITFAHLSGVRRFTKRHNAAALMSADQSWAMVAMTEREVKEFTELDRTAKKVFGSTECRPVTRIHTPEERPRVLQSLEAGGFLRAVQAHGYSSWGGPAENITDNNIRSGWKGRKSGWLSLRYAAPVRTKGVLLCIGHKGIEVHGFENVTLTINATVRVQLPQKAEGGIIVVDFGRPLDLLDLHFEVYSGALRLDEIYVVNANSKP